jgi:hypothetical protein
VYFTGFPSSRCSSPMPISLSSISLSIER